MANYTRFQLRGDTKANWLSVNPILAKNEPAIETDTNRFKIGDGVSTYSQLSYGRNTGEYSSLYNVTSLFPLPSGYYSHESAVLAIPVGERIVGLIITYATSASVWYTERFIGTNVSGWTTVSNWERIPNASDVSRLDTNIAITTAHIANKANPHEVTKAQVGLGNVDNTSDVNKPISSATQTALNGKVNNSGNEVISGIKTFSSSPIVPTPTTDMQSSTKKYVDDSKTEIQSKQIIAGTGLTGGGAISADRTLNVVSANDGITSNADNIQLNTIDNLSSTSPTKPLSANQGRVIDTRLSSAENDIDNLQTDFIELDSELNSYRQSAVSFEINSLNELTITYPDTLTDDYSINDNGELILTY